MVDYLLLLETVADGLDGALTWEDENGLNYAIDGNGDGIADILAIDSNEDGCIDILDAFSEYDEWGNPHHEDVFIDSDHNGVPDVYKQVDYDDWGYEIAMNEANDYNQDGIIDMEKVYVDTNSDGEFDLVASMHIDNSDSEVLFTNETFMDLTGDHQPDESIKIQGLDLDHDGEPDTIRIWHAGPDGAYSDPVELSYQEYLAMNEMDYTTILCSNSAVEGQFDPTTDPEFVSGDPYSSLEHWEFQGPTGRCAIYAQKFALEEILGREIPIEELVSVAEENGWFNEDRDSGTASLNMDKLLEYYGVNHEMSFDNDLASLEDALNNGQKVIVGVDSGQIWYGDENNIFSPDNCADHAVQVIGIDRSDSNNPMVILNDSGSPSGCGEMVALSVFEDAWKAGDSQMIVCWA